MGILTRRHDKRIDWEMVIPFHARFLNGLGTLFICLSWLPFLLIAEFSSSCVIAAILLLAEIAEHFNRFFNRYLDLRK